MDYKKCYQKMDNSRLATYELTVQNVLKLLGHKKEGRVLDIGCGNGIIDIMLANQTNFKITGCDISDVALNEAKKNAEKERATIIFEKQDVFKLDYPDNYFDVVFSFGYASTASFRGAQERIYRILKPGGLLILDFVNHLSLYKVLRFRKNLIRFRVYKNEKTKYYHFGGLGIREYFEKIGFSFVSKIYFNTYPPIKFIPAKIYILFENTIGRLFRKILGRVILVCFQK